MNDVEYYESYGYSHEDAKNQAAADRATTGLIVVVFRLFFAVFKLFFLFLPAIFCAYLILEWLKKPLGNPVGWNYVGWMCGAVYLVESVVFFLKGWHLQLKANANRWWIVLRVICLVYCLALPVVMTREFVLLQFTHEHPPIVSTLAIMSWISGLVLGLLIFQRYRLNQDHAPLWFLWAYRLGCAAGR